MSGKIAVNRYHRCVTIGDAAGARSRAADLRPHAHVEVVHVLRALAEPARLSLVHLLVDGPRRVTDLTAELGLAQSTVSAHLAVLRSAGLVTLTPQGRATWYALADAELEGLLGAAERVVARLEPA